MNLKLRKKPPSDIDQVVETIKSKYVSFKKSMNMIHEAQRAAFDRMYDFGQYLLTHEKIIKDNYKTWGRFGDQHGIRPSVLSRCKSSVSDFKLHGANTLEEARQLLESRGYTPSAKLMESNINRLLTDNYNGEKQPPKDRSVKKDQHVRELQNLGERANEIMDEHEPDDEIYQEAKHISEFTQETIQHLENIAISQKQWSSQMYLDFCRKINYDVIMGKPVKKSEPMHLGVNGESGSTGGKVADFLAIPGCRDTHNKLDKGQIKLTYEEIADLHRWTLINFIIHTIASD
jgi:hypothetical protein